MSSAVHSPSRCARMVQCLKEGFVYSEKKIRDVLFTEIEGLVETGAARNDPYILSRLTREASDRGRAAGEGTGIRFSNWDMAAGAVVNAMLCAGVLLTAGGQTVPAGIAARASRIIALKPRFRDLTEAFLLEFLIRKLGDVKIHDHLALAHALFRQFDPSVPVGDLEDRVVILMATLADRITLREDGTYALLDRPESLPSSSNAVNA